MLMLDTGYKILDTGIALEYLVVYAKVEKAHCELHQWATDRRCPRLRSTDRWRWHCWWMWQRAPLSVGKLRSSANARRRFATRQQSMVANDALVSAMAMP